MGQINDLIKNMLSIVDLFPNIATMATPTEDVHSFKKELDSSNSDDINYESDHENILKQEIAKSQTMANFTHRKSLSTTNPSLIIDTNVNVVQQRRIAGTPLKQSVYTATSSAQTSSPSKGSNTSSMTPNSANALGVFGRYLGRKRESVSFFLNLGSPVKKSLELPNVDEIQEEAEGDTSPRKGVPPVTKYDNVEEPKPKEKKPVTSFPKIKSYENRLPATQMKELLEKKLRRASIARDRILDERKESLRKYAESIRMKQLVLDSRRRLEQLYVLGQS